MNLKCENCCYYYYNEEYVRDMCNFWDETRTAPCEEVDVVEEVENETDE